MSQKRVAVIGASANPDRYSNMAVRGYQDKGYEVWPVHPSAQPVAGLTCYTDIASLPGQADVISMYVNPKLGLQLVDEITEHKPQFVWLNPGADSDELEQALADKNVAVMRTCNLVALSMGDPIELAQKHNQ